ncbi:MotA/TolQ/ExbB proton channel family protein [Anaerohalosphaera lusitana]|uniref:MotA/TolQ/ExbB proton channel family protein n=1 Tax=Anaerohalosphaera lusitana TaxID=1936003 RepID=UPI001473ACA7|nr:MotA/TolQ/ExbB proton channel family protein [Anaerohalosphaera lusitana]
MTLCLAMLCVATAFGAEDGDQETRISLWSTIAAGGIIGYIILLTSLVVLALVVEGFINIRHEKLIPTGLADDVRENLRMGEYQRAKEMCTEDDSFLGRVIAAGLNEVNSMFGFFDMQNAMQEVSERNISKLYRRLDYLSFIAAVAPMMGLLGTVTGMIRSFNQIALTEGAARPSELAGGISEALVTTCLGLVVAIPAMFFATFFRNRIDNFVAEAEIEVERLMGRFRKGKTENTGAGSA